MRPMLCIVFGLSIAASTSTFAQTPSPTTQTGTASKGVNKGYSFTPATFGQVTATLSWDTPNAKLLMVLVCGSSEPQTYGIAAGLLDRFARFESGVIGGDPCALVVTSADETANFRLHVIRSGDQFLTPAGFIALTEAREGTLLTDEAGRVLNRLKQLIR